MFFRDLDFNIFQISDPELYDLEIMEHFAIRDVSKGNIVSLMRLINILSYQKKFHKALSFLNRYQKDIVLFFIKVQLVKSY